MNCKELKVKIKDDGVPYIFNDVKFCVEDNMLVVDDTNTSTYCFPMENVLYYRFEKQ
jgi:hypothetical protein